MLDRISRGSPSGNGMSQKRVRGPELSASRHSQSSSLDESRANRMRPLEKVWPASAPRAYRLGSLPGGDEIRRFMLTESGDSSRRKISVRPSGEMANLETPSSTSRGVPPATLDRKSTRLNSSHLGISYAVFCLK